MRYEKGQNIITRYKKGRDIKRDRILKGEDVKMKEDTRLSLSQVVSPFDICALMCFCVFLCSLAPDGRVNDTPQISHVRDVTGS